MGIVDKIKSDVKKSGQNKSKFIYFREGSKVRIRFLADMEDALEITFHDSFEKSINVPCQEIFGRDCPYCGDDDLRTRSQYCWPVYNYETKEVQLFMFPVNNCSPIPSLVAMYENYGTLTDRDYVVSVTGKQQNKTFTVIPMDKEKFRNSKAKAFTESAMLKMIDKAFPCDSDDDDDEEYKSKSKSKKSKASSKKAKEDDWDDEDEDTEMDYEDMTPKELYKECMSRDIEALPKKSAKYYINLLEEYDEAQDDWDDEDEDDENDWEDED